MMCISYRKDCTYSTKVPNIVHWLSPRYDLCVGCVFKKNPSYLLTAFAAEVTALAALSFQEMCNGNGLHPGK